MSVLQTNKSIFDLDAEVIINPVNCVGVMGKGLALEMKKRYPWCLLDYKNACSPDHGMLPSDLTVSLNPDSTTNPKQIIHIATKNHWRQASTFAYVELGLIRLAGYIRATNFKSYAVPALGCGLGGLNWFDVRDLMIRQLSDLEPTIYIIGPK